MIEPILNERGFYIEELRGIVVGDLHIGYERELANSGIKVPSQTRAMRQRIEVLIKRYHAEKLILLGDLKHEILGFHPDIEAFFANLPVDVLMVKGNHDGGIENMVDFPVYPAEGLRLGDYGFFHGHSWPSREVLSATYVFMGHMHPEIQLTDSLGKPHRYPCHLRARLNSRGVEKFKASPQIIIVAAFNPLVGAAIGTPVGPLFRNNLIGEVDVFLLNGTYLGKYPSIESLSPR